MYVYYFPGKFYFIYLCMTWNKKSNCSVLTYLALHSSSEFFSKGHWNTKYSNTVFPSYFQAKKEVNGQHKMKSIEVLDVLCPIMLCQHLYLFFSSLVFLQISCIWMCMTLGLHVFYLFIYFTSALFL